MRVHIYGKRPDADLATEILCVLGAVSHVVTFEKSDGSVDRYVNVQFFPGTLEDLGVVLDVPIS